MNKNNSNIDRSNTNNQASDIKKIKCNSKHELYQAQHHISKLLTEHGYCVIDAWDSSVETLHIIADLFGQAQLHVRANHQGVVGEGEQNSEWKQYKHEYLGISNEEFLPHTDGTFLHGVARNEEHLNYIGPPKMMLLQCVQPASAGGENYIIDGQKVLCDIIKNHPEHLRALFCAGCATFCRDDLLALNLPIYTKHNNGKIKIRFRYDSVLYVPRWSFNTVNILHHQYHLNKKYQIFIPLQKDQILVLDNFRMLHARNAFTSANVGTTLRKLRRIWIYDDADHQLVNVDNKYHDHRALEPYKAYKNVTHRNNARLKGPVIKYEPGISLPPEYNLILNALI